MFSKLTPYVSPAATRSSLFKGLPETIPPMDELESVQLELKNLKQRTLEKAKKAGEDLKSIEESMRRMKDREKGKAKAIEKIKRERGSVTPIPDAEEQKISGHLHTASSKASLPLGSIPSSSRSSLDPRRPTIDELKKKKKKRKRDFDDSDVELESQRPRKAASPPPPPPHQHPYPPKPSKATTASSHPHSKQLAGPDFSVPPPTTLLPPRPPVPPPPIPGPSKPTDVMEDFSKSKPPSQVVVSTFYSSIEPWIRGIKEEDIGFLEYTMDEVEPYVMPKFGQRYAVLEDQSIPSYGSRNPQASSSGPPMPKWDPSTLMEPDLLTEERGHGPLTERLVSALLPMPDLTVWKGVKAAEDAMEGRPGGYGAAAARREKVNVSDLEERIKDTMRFNGLLDGAPDYSERVDDPIATALRHAQRELRTVVATNKARKERLAAIARDRLGYQEYLDLRDSIDKNISTLFAKLQKKDVPKTGKKKKKGMDVNGNGNANGTSTPGLPPPCPAAVGFITDDENRLVVSDQLRQLVETRRKWVDTVGGVFEEKQREMPGRIWGLPKTSIYDGIEDTVRRDVERATSTVPSNGSDPWTTSDKGKGRARGDEMDVG